MKIAQCLFTLGPGWRNTAERLIVAAALVLAAPQALAKCPRTVVGTWSGLLQLESFNEGGGYNDKATALGRLVFQATGYQAIFLSRNSLDRDSEEVSLTGDYSYSATTCQGRVGVGGSDYRFLITDNGRVMVGMLFTPADAEEKDVATFTLYKE